MTRPQLVPWFKGLSALTAVLVLLQAFMAGRFLFAGSDLIQEHEINANLVFLSVVIQTLFLLGMFGWRRSLLLIVNLALLLLVVVQIGLGYSDSGSAIAWHVANGAFVFGISCFNLAMALQIPRSTAV